MRTTYPDGKVGTASALLEAGADPREIIGTFRHTMTPLRQLALCSMEMDGHRAAPFSPDLATWISDLCDECDAFLDVMEDFHSASEQDATFHSERAS